DSARRVRDREAGGRRGVTRGQREGRASRSVPEREVLVRVMARNFVVAGAHAPAALLAHLALDIARIEPQVETEEPPAEGAGVACAAVELDVADGVSALLVEPVVLAELGGVLVHAE